MSQSTEKEFRMSYNLPPGVTDADIDREMGGECTPEESRAFIVLDRAHAAYKDALKAVAAQLAKHRIYPAKGDFSALAEWIGESIASDPEIYDAWKFLNSTAHDASYTPENEKQIVDEVYEALVDSLRLKPLDALSIVLNGLRPVLTNPATHAQSGEGL